MYVHFPSFLHSVLFVWSSKLKHYIIFHRTNVLRFSSLIGKHNDFSIWQWDTTRYTGLFLFHCYYSSFSFFLPQFPVKTLFPLSNKGKILKRNIGNFFPVYSSSSNTSLPFQAIYNGSLNNLEWSLQAHNLLTPIGSLL